MPNPSPVAALIIRPDGTAEVTEVAPTLEALQGVVGGYLEPVWPASEEFGAWHAYVDEDGRVKGAPENVVGSEFLRSIGGKVAEGWTLRGPVVVVGTRPDAGALADADVPAEVVGAAVRRWGLSEAR